MKNPELAERVLAHVLSPDFRPVKAKVILKQLQLAEEQYRELHMTIKRLVQSGQLVYGANHLVGPPGSVKADSNSIQGTIRIAAGGYGFVRPPTPTKSPKGGKSSNSEDIFIPASLVGSALDGDTVQVRLKSNSRGGGARGERSGEGVEGEVVEVIERSRRQFSGTFQRIQGESVVWLDGVNTPRPILVGDVRGLPLDANDKVVVELVRFPEPNVQGEGIILEVLGSSKNPAVDTLAVMRQFGLQEEFPAEVIEQARQMADSFVEGVPSDRRDLTQVPTLTIDPRDARDFDDAISLSKNEVGNWVLQVHIADVAHFVPAGTALDLEARRRGTSVYLPDKVIPMLPELISNHLASLQPNKVRLTKTVLMEMTVEGIMVHWEVFNSAIHNDQRLTYEQVDQFLADREAWKERLTPEIHQLLADMDELAMVLRARRMKHGSIELTLPDIKIDLDKLGKVRGAHLEIYTESHQIIEEFMLAANQTVATWLDDLKIPFLRRAHPSPERRKLLRLTEFVRDLGIKAENLEDRFEIQSVVQQVRGKSTEYAVNYAILKSMSKATYQPQQERHYALDMTHYCHFTSPIRRYPDLTVHRTVQKLIDQQNAIEPMGVLIRLGQQCSDQEQNAEAAERELIKVKLLHFLSRKVGEPMRGVIVSVNAEGFFVRGLELPADGLVPVHALPADRYFFERSGQMLIGHKRENRFRLGDELTVAIDHVDLARRTLLYRFVENHSLAAHSELEPVIARPKSAREAERKMAGKNDRKSRGGKSFKGKGAKGKKGGGRAKPGKKPKRR